MLLVHLLTTIGHDVAHLTPVQLENFARCVHEVAPRLSHGFNQSQIDELVPILFAVSVDCVCLLYFLVTMRNRCICAN